MEPFLVFPDPPPPLLVQTLDLAGYSWKAVANASIAAQLEPPDGWAGAVVTAENDAEGAFETRRVPDREQLLGIMSVAGAADFLWRGHRQGKHAIVQHRAAVAAAFGRR